MPGKIPDMFFFIDFKKGDLASFQKILSVRILFLKSNYRILCLNKILCKPLYATKGIWLLFRGRRNPILFSTSIAYSDETLPASG